MRIIIVIVAMRLSSKRANPCDNPSNPCWEWRTCIESFACRQCTVPMTNAWNMTNKHKVRTAQLTRTSNAIVSIIIFRRIRVRHGRILEELNFCVYGRPILLAIYWWNSFIIILELREFYSLLFFPFNAAWKTSICVISATVNVTRYFVELKIPLRLHFTICVQLDDRIWDHTRSVVYNKSLFHVFWFEKYFAI